MGRERKQKLTFRAKIMDEASKQEQAFRWDGPGMDWTEYQQMMLSLKHVAVMLAEATRQARAEGDLRALPMMEADAEGLWRAIQILEAAQTAAERTMH